MFSQLCRCLGANERLPDIGVQVKRPLGPGRYGRTIEIMVVSGGYVEGFTIVLFVVVRDGGVGVIVKEGGVFAEGKAVARKIGVEPEGVLVVEPVREAHVGVQEIGRTAAVGAVFGKALQDPVGVACPGCKYVGGLFSQRAIDLYPAGKGADSCRSFDPFPVSFP